MMPFNNNKLRLVSIFYVDIGQILLTDSHKNADSSTKNDSHKDSESTYDLKRLSIILRKKRNKNIDMGPMKVS